jgi:hypothetical protein
MMSSAKLQRAAEIVMVLGIVALCQPWNLFLHRYGVTIILIGLLTFMFTNWFGKPAAAREEEMDGVFDVSDHHDGLKPAGHHDGLKPESQPGSRHGGGHS